MVYGIGNPLIDIVIRVTDDELAALGVDKGIMRLVTLEEQSRVLDALGSKRRTYLPGGSAPNTMLALAGLGVEAVISGKIGDGEFGRTYEAQVSAYGITSRLVHGTGATGSCVILVTPDGERSMNTHLGMCQEFSRVDLDEELLKRADYLHFTGYMWDTEVQKDAIHRAIEIATETGASVVFDVADPFAVDRYRDDFLELIRDHVDVVFANRREASILYGEPTDAQLASRLAQDVEVAVLKIGKDGSIVVRSGESIHTPGNDVAVIDTTGAGDMFAAGFIAGLASGQDVGSASILAGQLAERVIGKPGAQFTYQEILTIRNETAGVTSAE